jgi:hypothetical protein
VDAAHILDLCNLILVEPIPGGQGSFVAYESRDPTLGGNCLVELHHVGTNCHGKHF